MNSSVEIPKWKTKDIPDRNKNGTFKDSIMWVLCRADDDERPYCKLFQDNGIGDCAFFADDDLVDARHGYYHLCTHKVDKKGTK